jgi:hypothetical protein
MRRLLVTLTIALFFASSGCAIYQKPEFIGKVIDVETKDPIEGAVVVAAYYERPVISGPGGGSATVINVRETVTRKDGTFLIPAYSTILRPFSGEYRTLFTVFKPGYASIPGWDLEELLSKGAGKESIIPWIYNKDLKFRLFPGVIELPRLITVDERMKASPGLPTGYTEAQLPLLFNAIQEDYQSR